ncbi:hypothetical protein JT06_13460 [Desulfobulbus sp. Tol-SR]|nr:hypothetical protein JT06_13460 [Desulfobulbus sp. Tol-SR]
MFPSPNLSDQLPPARYYLSKLLLKCRSPEIILLDLACELFSAGCIADHVDQHMPHFNHYLGLTSVLFTVCIAVQITQTGKVVFENFLGVALFKLLGHLDLIIAAPGRHGIASAGQDSQGLIILLAMHADFQPVTLSGMFQLQEKLRLEKTPFFGTAQFHEGLVFFDRILCDAADSNSARASPFWGFLAIFTYLT